MRGLTFTIPNQYGQYLAAILAVVPVKQFVWQTGGEEAYYIEQHELGAPLFPAACVMTGEELFSAITAADSYVIFADLKAFPSKADVATVQTYADFLRSDCQFVLLVVDCSYVTIYAKSLELLDLLLNHAVANNFEDIERIYDETDARTSLKVF